MPALRTPIAAASLGLAIMAAITVPANAQTVANGPYYAMPSWDQTLPSASRFVVLSNFDSRAVLDRETGLVWERFPGRDAVPAFAQGNLQDLSARSYCERLVLGNRRGWRLSSVTELHSLSDPTQRNPALPPGHPFSLSPESYYLTANVTVLSGQTFRRTYDMTDGTSVTGVTSGSFEVWCVRGGTETLLE